MKVLNVDVAVIGAGTAGLAAYRAAKTAGAKVALIEGGEYGTTCARVGCMPSKLLIAAAEAVHAAQLAPGFGIHIEGKIRVDGREVMARLRSERDRFVGFVVRDVERIPDTDRIRGHARFENDRTLIVDDALRITATSVVIATGSRVTYPDAFKKLGDRLVINDDVFDWTDLPESVAVIGPGVIGLELGQALHRLGVRVAILGRGGRVGPIADPEIRAYAIQALSSELVLEPDAHFVSMDREGDRVAIRRKDADGVERTEHFDYVLATTGRSPNVDRIGLENTTVDRDASGVPVFDATTGQTVNAAGASSIFVAGDASNFIPLLHEAADEGRIAGENAVRVAAGKPVARGIRRAPLGVVFTDPQIAIVGGGWQALEQGRFVTGQVSFEDQGRSRVILKNKGLLNVYGDIATGRLLGAEMIGPAAEHLGHLLAWALQNQMTIQEMLEMPFYHPVIEEGLRTALRDLDAKLRSAQAHATKAA
ncbi:MAG: dihydrolipoamide dehydrogenase [Betaproteobacteria bacterium]|nr:dihydrolipoamide dehydrogenase [Betaproteobacteria bacterium]